MVPRLLRAVRTWFAMRRQPLVFTGETDDALRQLGRSIRLLRRDHAAGRRSSRARTGPPTLARSLQIATRRQIDDDWRTGPIMAVGDREPQAVQAPVVDAATRDELAALASASPQALLARPVPSSVLARTARHAALLEWSRLARAAVEASVDIRVTPRPAGQGADLGQRHLHQRHVPCVLPAPHAAGRAGTTADRSRRRGRLSRSAPCGRSNRSSPCGPSIPIRIHVPTRIRRPIRDRTRCRRASRR